MKPLLQAAVIVILAAAGAGLTRVFRAPAPRAVACDASRLQPGQVCLADLMAENNPELLWVDARARSDWNRLTVAGSVLWNLDKDEDMAAFEVNCFQHAMNGQPVVVFCDSEACGTSGQVADRIRKLEAGGPVRVLYGGWRALSQAGGGGPPLAPGS